ncbi:MAG: hypothetical protein IM618_14450 [Cytophagales bacterium]|jgi:hypothetical protein|nr:hypothetical protein [Cytophagales bacterium]
MKKVLAIIQNGLTSSSGKTEELKSLSRLFKKELTKELDLIGATLTKYTLGHFYFSGFFRVHGICYYFSLDDLRNKNLKVMMWRKAKDENDYRGEGNRHVYLADGMARAMTRELAEDIKHHVKIAA